MHGWNDLRGADVGCVAGSSVDGWLVADAVSGAGAWWAVPDAVLDHGAARGGSTPDAAQKKSRQTCGNTLSGIIGKFSIEV